MCVKHLGMANIKNVTTLAEWGNSYSFSSVFALSCQTGAFATGPTEAPPPQWRQPTISWAFLRYPPALAPSCSTQEQTSGRVTPACQEVITFTFHWKDSAVSQLPHLVLRAQKCQPTIFQTVALTVRRTCAKHDTATCGTDASYLLNTQPVITRNTFNELAHFSYFRGNQPNFQCDLWDHFKNKDFWAKLIISCTHC